MIMTNLNISHQLIKEIETVRKSQLRQFLSYHRTIAGFCKKVTKGCEKAVKEKYEKNACNI